MSGFLRVVAFSGFAYRDKVHLNILEATVRSGEFECVTLSASASEYTMPEEIFTYRVCIHMSV